MPAFFFPCLIRRKLFYFDCLKLPLLAKNSLGNGIFLQSYLLSEFYSLITEILSKLSIFISFLEALDHALCLLGRLLGRMLLKWVAWMSCASGLGPGVVDATTVPLFAISKMGIMLTCLFPYPDLGPCNEPYPNRHISRGKHK